MIKLKVELSTPQTRKEITNRNLSKEQKPKTRRDVSFLLSELESYLSDTHKHICTHVLPRECTVCVCELQFFITVNVKKQSLLCEVQAYLVTSMKCFFPTTNYEVRVSWGLVKITGGQNFQRSVFCLFLFVCFCHFLCKGLLRMKTQSRKIQPEFLCVAVIFCARDC